MKIKAVIWQENGVWCGSVPALPGCHTWGGGFPEAGDCFSVSRYSSVSDEGASERVSPEGQFPPK